MDHDPIRESTTRRGLLRPFLPEGIPWPGSIIYDRISAARIFREHYERVAQHILTYCSAGHLLDIGTGPARLLITLHDALPSMGLSGIDISPAMVARARKNVESSGLVRDIQIKEGAAASIPFPDGTFDVVVSTVAIHHWKDPAGGLNEVYRVLKGGRYALIYDVVSDTPPHILEQMECQFGRLPAALLRIPALRGHLLRLDNLHQLPENTPFRRGEIGFVGILCCLILKKEIPDIVA